MLDARSGRFAVGGCGPQDGMSEAIRSLLETPCLRHLGGYLAASPIMTQFNEQWLVGVEKTVSRGPLLMNWGGPSIFGNGFATPPVL